jgi:phosphate transport system permease protein
VQIEVSKIERVDLFASKPRRGDLIFFGFAKTAAYFAFSLVFLVFIFLSLRSASTFKEQGLAFVTGSTWDQASNTFQIMPMLVGSLVLVVLALFVAVPSSIAVAYFIEFMAPARVARWTTNIVDLLAALPSIVIAIWGAFVFTPVAAGWGRLLNQYFGSIPVFRNDVDNYYRSPFIGGWILAIMMIPIITSVSREVISRVDKELVNAAYALGATRFSAMRRVILPTARGGILGGILLGIGRGLGETIAILYTINLIFHVNIIRILENRGGSVAPMIASYYGEADGNAISALLAAGVVLFLLTLIVNMFATFIVQRSEKKMAS